MRRAPLSVLVAVLISVGLSAQSKPDADTLARSLQQRYQGIRDFSADFVHAYRGGVLRTQTLESGTVLVKKPGKMRWTYTKPEKKEFVSDGTKLYSYLESDRQVRVSDVPPADQATTPALFLTGKGDIARDFSAAYVDSSVPGTLALKLTPRRAEPDYEYLVVALDPSSLQIKALTTRDHQRGESTLTFSNLKENRNIADREFTFRIPQGVKVVNDGTRD